MARSAESFEQIVLLGHTGYIGRRLAVALAEAAPGTRFIGRSVTELDLTGPNAGASLEPLLTPKTALVICAAIKKQLGDTLDVLAQNLAITTNICKALAAKPVKRVLFFSSAAVYGEDVQHDTITEQTPVQPRSYYGIGKFTSERMLLKTAAQHPSMSLLMVRPALVYGPDEPGYYYGPSGFLQKARAGQPITLWGDGTELREFLFIDDVVEVTTRLLFGTAGGWINVVSGTSRTYVDALKAVAAITGKAPVTDSRPRTNAKVDHRFCADAVKQACPGFSFTTLEEGLRRS